MTFFILRRLFQSVVLLAVVSLLVFLAVFAIGNPVDILINFDATPEEITRIKRQMGFHLPLWQQYFVFIGSALQGDFGNSFINGAPALKLVVERLPATLELAIAALLVSVVAGIPLGLVAGLRPRKPSSQAIMAGSILGFSSPSFWAALVLILVFGVQLGWLPTGGRGETVDVLGVQLSFLTADGLAHMVLPTITFALYPTALAIRLTRAGTREIVLLDFVRFARAKGLSEKRVIFVHVLKNILVPIVTVMGVQLGILISYAVVTETIFAWPGMGKLIIDSIYLVDRPVMVAFLMFAVFIFTLINLIVDITYSFLDPRIRISELR